HRFRVLDLAVTGASFAFVGACLPGLRAKHEPRTTDWLERLAWALAAWVVLSGQYLLFGYWDLAQRESFFDWFMLPSVALQLMAQTPVRPSEREAGGRRKTGGWGAAGAWGLVPCSGSRPSRSSPRPRSWPCSPTASSRRLAAIDRVRGSRLRSAAPWARRASSRC